MLTQHNVALHYPTLRSICYSVHYQVHRSLALNTTAFN